MAHAVDFPGSNRIYGPPPGRDDVGTLHAFVNGACVVSAWEPTDKELAEIIRSRRIFLSVMSGGVLFPVLVGAESVVRSVAVDYGGIWESGPTCDVFPNEDPMLAYAVIAELKGLVREAAEQFRFYEASHRAKVDEWPVGDPRIDDTLRKAQVNRQMAERCERALA